MVKQALTALGAAELPWIHAPISAAEILGFAVVDI